VIVCKSAAELDRMRAPNRLVAEVLQALEETVAPGVTTEDLDVLAERMVRDGGAVPAFKGYRGFPATLCASVNEEVVHGIPSSKRPLRDGDIISLDVGVKLDGFFGDSAVTVAVGQIPERTQALLRVTRESLERAIEKVQVGGRLSDIGHAVQQWVEANGFAIVREFVGHGIGERLHEDPQIPNYGQPGRGATLASGVAQASATPLCYFCFGLSGGASVIGCMRPGPPSGFCGVGLPVVSGAGFGPVSAGLFMRVLL
jgi:methionyl aminopeptidase